MTQQLLILVLGAILGYCSGWLKSAIDERRRRRAVATALLVESFRIDHMLDYLVSRWRGGKAVSDFATPMHDRFTSDVQLFDPLSVARVLDFTGHMAELRHQLQYFNTATNTEQRARLPTEIREFAANVRAKGEIAKESLSPLAGSLPAPSLLPQYGEEAGKP
jgi:hypothetical protein